MPNRTDQRPLENLPLIRLVYLSLRIGARNTDFCPGWFFQEDGVPLGIFIGSSNGLQAREIAL